jgi:cation diffusion facilitator CzcD-associated flavoprotein CzcO
MPGAYPLWCATTASPHNIDGASPTRLNAVDMQGPTARRTESIDVAIIGAGPAGLAAGAALRKAGVQFVILERKPTVGSSWRAHYERLHLHTIKQMSALPYRPFPATYPRYVPKALMIEYLDGYAEEFELRPRLEESARSVRRDGDAWQVETTSASIRARHVVVATGLNGDPVMPPVAGIERFPGVILHSALYVNPTPFAGQSVLVVGMGNTGAEIALDLSCAGAVTSISVRSGVHIAPRDLFGIPIQLVATAATKLLPTAVNDAIFPTILDIALGQPKNHGIRRPNEGILHCIASRGRIPVLDVGTVGKIAEGAIKMRTEIASVQGRCVHFSDATTGRFDAIIFATGYRTNYSSFLASDWAHLPYGARPEPGRPSSLHFIGFRSPVTGLLREIAAEATTLAARIAGDR